MGFTYYCSEDYNKAIMWFHKVLYTTYNHAATYDGLGRALKAIGKRRAALQHCYKAVEIDPDNVVIRFNFSIMLHALRRYSRALQEF
jgi:tetratricopeptide (TPR) repeat protein